MKERNAAHLLLTEFVKREAEDIARALEPLIPIYGEVTRESLKDNMRVVAQTFAGLALQLIDHNSSLDPNDTDNMILPCGAKTMHSTLEELSRFIEGTRQLMWTIGDKHYDEETGELIVEDSGHVKTMKRFRIILEGCLMALGLPQRLAYEAQC